MKVLDLACDGRHAFEGWFGSEEDFQQQLARGLVECPLCGSRAVHKLLSAPRLNLGAEPARRASASAEPVDSTSSTSSAPAAGNAQPAPVQPAEAAMQAAWLKMMRHVVANSEDVGTRFAEHARRMHYGEADPRSIRGQASRDEAEALLEEGIAVMPLMLPPMLDSTEH